MSDIIKQSLSELIKNIKDKKLSSTDRSWIPNKCFWEILIALDVLDAIKINSIAIIQLLGKH